MGTLLPADKPEWQNDCPEEFMFGMDSIKWKVFCGAGYLFAEHDYAEISMRQIADLVQIPPLTVYYHFESKEAILQTIYNYMEHYITLYMPGLDELLLKAEQEEPRTVLVNMHFYYPEPIQRIMAQFTLVCAKRMRVDARADSMLRWLLIDVPYRYITALLNKLLELDKIEPLDVRAMAELFTNNYYGAALRMYSSYPVEDEVWRRSFSMLFDIVHPKPQKARHKRSSMLGGR